mgnify:CR=1 FL=1
MVILKKYPRIHKRPKNEIILRIHKKDKLAWLLQGDFKNHVLEYLNQYIVGQHDSWHTRYSVNS